MLGGVNFDDELPHKKRIVGVDLDELLSLLVLHQLAYLVDRCAILAGQSNHHRSRDRLVVAPFVDRNLDEGRLRPDGIVNRRSEVQADELEPGLWFWALDRNRDELRCF